MGNKDTLPKLSSVPLWSYTEIAIGLSVLTGLYIISSYNYLLFHSLAEIFSIAIAAGLFMIAWNTRRVLDNQYLLFIGIAYLFVGIIDTIHTFVYTGVGIVGGLDTNPPTQLWIAARYTESLSLLFAPLFFRKRLQAELVFFGYALITLFILSSIFFFQIFPDCYIQGKGLTPFKVASEFVISGILLGALILLMIHREEFDSGVFKLIIMSISATIASELSFTVYINVNELSNLIGHYLKILSFYLIYKAIIQTGLTRPYDLLFRNLRASEERYRGLVELSPDAILINRNNKIVFVNPAALQLFGATTAEQILGKSPFDIFHSDYHSIMQDRIRKLANGQPAELIEEKIVRMDGTVRDVEVAASSFLDQEGPAIQAILRDITERIEAEKALLISEERYRALFNSMTEGFAIHEIVCDEKGDPSDYRFLDVNPAFERLTGLKRENVIGRLVSEVLPDIEPHWIKTYGTVALTGQSIHFESHAAALDKYYEMFAYRPAPGQFAVVFMDISERKRAEEVLQTTLQRFYTVFSSIQSSILLVTDKGRVEYANQAFCDYFELQDSLADLGHLSSHDMIEKIRNAYRNPDEAVTRIREIVGQGQPVIGEEVAMRGERTCVRDFIPLNVDGKSYGRLWHHWDITERKRAEESLRRKEARFRLLSDTAGRLLATDDPQGLVNELCRDVMEYLDCQAFFNFMVDEHAGRLRLNACAGIPEEEVRRLEWLDYGVAVCGCAARDKTRIIAEDIFHSPDVRTELVRSYGIQAYCCHPLKAQDRLIGTLSFGTKTRARFTPEEVELMRIVADQVSVAVQRIQAEHDLRQSEEALRLANEHLEQRVRERTMDLQNLTEQLERSRYELRKLASELVMAEERERKRIAGVLHDEIAQTLAAVRMRLDLLQGIPSDLKDKQTLKEAKVLLVQSLQETRALMNDLGNPLLFDMGLKPACEALANRLMERHPVRIRCDIRDAYKHLNPDVKAILYQVVRELLTNIVKHSQAQNAHVMIDMENGKFRVKVTDDGVGFDPQRLGAPTVEGGFGLYSIRERLIAIDGSLRVESAPGTGTVATAIVPAALD